jgi:hypothetical protein
MAQQAQKEELTLVQIDQSNPVTRGSTALVYKKDMTIEEDAEKACRQKMPQQTAVEWLLSELQIRLLKIKSEPDGIVRETMIYNFLIDTEQADQMYKEQIGQAYMEGLIDGMNQQPKEYYNETYGTVNSNEVSD